MSGIFLAIIILIICLAILFNYYANALVPPKDVITEYYENRLDGWGKRAYGELCDPPIDDSKNLTFCKLAPHEEDMKSWFKPLIDGIIALSETRSFTVPQLKPDASRLTIPMMQNNRPYYSFSLWIWIDEAPDSTNISELQLLNFSDEKQDIPSLFLVSKSTAIRINIKGNTNASATIPEGYIVKQRWINLTITFGVNYKIYINGKLLINNPMGQVEWNDRLILKLGSSGLKGKIANCKFFPFVLPELFVKTTLQEDAPVNPLMDKCLEETKNLTEKDAYAKCMSRIELILPNEVPGTELIMKGWSKNTDLSLRPPSFKPFGMVNVYSGSATKNNKDIRTEFAIKPFSNITTVRFLHMAHALATWGQVMHCMEWHGFNRNLPTNVNLDGFCEVLSRTNIPLNKIPSLNISRDLAYYQNNGIVFLGGYIDFPNNRRDMELATIPTQLLPTNNRLIRWRVNGTRNYVELDGNKLIYRHVQLDNKIVEISFDNMYWNIADLTPLVLDSKISTMTKIYRPITGELLKTSLDNSGRKVGQKRFDVKNDLSNDLTISMFLTPERAFTGKYEFKEVPYGKTTKRQLVYVKTPVRVNPFNKSYGGEGSITLEPSGVLNFYYGSAGRDTTPYTNVSSSPIPFNLKTHVVLTRNISTGKITWFLNGNEDKIEDIKMPAKISNTPILIGRGYTNFNYKGRIENLQVFNRALSKEEIGKLQSNNPSIDVSTRMTPGYRVIGDFVKLGGCIRMTPTFTFQIVCVLPENARPNRNLTFECGPYTFRIMMNGEVKVLVRQILSDNCVSLEEIFFWMGKN
jgi:hypothetical protein